MKSSKRDTREEVWIAMSALWLDAELSQEALEQLALIVKNSGFSQQELNSIFNLELAPFLGANQNCVIGEWAGFDPDWVCENARLRQKSPRRID